MRLTSFKLSVPLLVFASFLPATSHADEAAVAKLLGERIIPGSVAQLEVEAFCESRVPPLPEVTSAQQWQAKAVQMRKDVLANVVFRGKAAEWRDAKVGVEWLDTIKTGKGYVIRKLRYESLPGLWIPALLYEPEKLSGKVPAALNVNGHDRNKGKAAKYKQIRCINMAKRGMLALNVEWVGMGQLRSAGFSHYAMNQLDLCGTSGLAVHYLGMSRALDLLLAHPNADPQRVAVAGLSGGGWQTIIISALDTRVTLSNPVAGYSSFRTRVRNHSDLGDSEQTPVDLAVHADYAQLTAMLAPRAALLTYNIKDNCCFASGHALPPLIEAAGPIYKLLGKEQRLRSHVNRDPGTHNFERDNRQALYQMIGDTFYSGSAEFSGDEIDSDSEVKSFDELAVPLPEKNSDFNQLALGVMKDLPRDAKLPGDKTAAKKWQTERAKQVAQVVRAASSHKLTAKQVGSDKHGDLTATRWQLKIDESWTVPAVELAVGDPEQCTIVFSAGGYQSAAAQVKRLLSEGKRVLAVDPFYFGQSKIPSRGFLFGLLVSAVGQRPLGIQAGQIAAVAKWLKDRPEVESVSVEAVGPRASLIALVAANLEPDGIDTLRLHKSFGSLKEIIEQNETVNNAPDLFCFGLLEQFDVKQLAALAAPRSVTFVEPSDRAKRELADLQSWYKLLGREFNPVQ